MTQEYGERFESAVWMFFITASTVLLGVGGWHLVSGFRELAGQ